MYVGGQHTVKIIVFGSFIGLAFLYSVVYLSSISNDTNEGYKDDIRTITPAQFKPRTNNNIIENNNRNTINSNEDQEKDDALEIYNLGKTLKVERGNYLWKNPLDPKIQYKTNELGYALVNKTYDEIEELLVLNIDELGVNNIVSAALICIDFIFILFKTNFNPPFSSILRRCRGNA